MDAAHLHLMLNHFPIAMTFVAFPILLVAGWRESEVLGRTGMIIAVFSGLVTIPTYLTGEPAEEIIEHLPGISEHMIKIHEKVAEKAIWFVAATAIAAMISLIVAFKRKSLPMRAIHIVLILSVCSASFLAWTNNLGGEIRHPEVRKNHAASPEVRGKSEKPENDNDD